MKPSTDPEPERRVSDASPAVPDAPSKGLGAAGGSPAADEPAAPSKEKELEAKVASLEDRLRRQQADFLNDVRRLQRAADERVKYAVQPVVEGLLGVADALHGAIEGLA